jgi:hypothetical protein
MRLGAELCGGSDGRDRIQGDVADSRGAGGS